MNFVPRIYSIQKKIPLNLTEKYIAKRYFMALKNSFSANFACLL